MSKKTTEETTAVADPILAAYPGERYLAFQPDTDQQEWLQECLETGISGADLETIKVPGSGGLQWELPASTGAVAASTFDGVIVALNRTRALWEHQYDGSKQRPLCSSADGLTGSGQPGGVCRTCPYNKWGTGKDGMGTACSERVLLYVLRENDALPIVLSLPIMSHANFRDYHNRLLRARNLLAGVVTQFGLERAKNSKGIAYSRVTFLEVGVLPPALKTAAKAYAATIKQAIGFSRAAGESVPDPESSSGTAGGASDEMPDSWDATGKPTDGIPDPDFPPRTGAGWSAKGR